MGSALLDTTTEGSFAETAADRSAAAHSASTEALRLQVAERLAAHRSRRGQVQAQHAQIQSQPSRSASARAAQIAATVAERYAHSQSYRAFLAAEAERAIQQAQAAAEVAAHNAQAVAAAQQRLLDAFDEDANLAREMQHADERGPQQRIEEEAHAVSEDEGGQELSLWPEPQEAATPAGKASETSRTSPHRRAAAKTPSAAGVAPASPQHAAVASPFADGFTVRLYEDAARALHAAPALPAYSAARGSYRPERSAAEALALDEEIAFRQSPVFEEPAGPPVPLPANLIEFPRQLVASRKARPRYAEGPLRDEGDATAGDGQLRIFEVDVAQISTEPAAADEDVPQWTSIWLDTPLGPAPGEIGAFSEQMMGTDVAQSYVPAAPFPQAASVGRRVMAAAINAGIVSAALVAFAAVFVVASGHSVPLHGVPLLAELRGMADYLTGEIGLAPSMIAGACVVGGALLYLLYQALFFWFSQATPGMRCARIALCTFDDENPTRSAMRRRLFAVLLSVCPFGLGFLWVALDEDRLAWHDRISRTYQRSY